MEWTTTSAFLRDLKNFQNEDVWDLFVVRFRPAILAFARRMGATERDLEDVCQDVLLAFANAYRAGGYDRSRGTLRTWLFTIAYRRTVDHLRSRALRSRENRSQEDGGVPLSSFPDERLVQQTWDHEWEAMVLAECLKRVKEEVRNKTYQAFKLLVLDERDPDQVALELDMSRNAVYIAKFRVLQRIEKLKEEFESRPS